MTLIINVFPRPRYFVAITESVSK